MLEISRGCAEPWELSCSEAMVWIVTRCGTERLQMGMTTTGTEVLLIHEG